jgi:hypothetical protein
MSSGNGAVDVLLWLVAFTLFLAFSAAVYAKDFVAFGVYGSGLLVCLAVQQYLKRSGRRKGRDDG